MSLKPGQIVSFSYFVPGVTNPQKEVFVLHPNWAGLVHAIDLGRLTPAERKILTDMMDPATKVTGHRIPMVNDILRRMDPLDEINSPQVFYSRFVKVFLKNKDAYRKYRPERMQNLRVVEDTVADGLAQAHDLGMDGGQPQPPAPPRPPGFPADRPAIGGKSPFGPGPSSGKPLFGETRGGLFDKKK